MTEPTTAPTMTGTSGPFLISSSPGSISSSSSSGEVVDVEDGVAVTVTVKAGGVIVGRLASVLDSDSVNAKGFH